MKTKLTEWLVKPYLNESPDLDIKVGDTILMGRFKNKKIKVKSITYNEKGDLLINGRPALKFRKYDKDKVLLPNKTTKKKSAEPDADRKGVDDEYPHFKEGFGGELSKSDKKKFEKERVENAEVLGYELTGTKDVKEAKRVPRKKGQHRGSKSHSDLYTDENPKGTIHGLKFATVKDAKASVSKIRNSGKKHAHKIQAAVAMEQRAREMGKTAQAAVYRAYINQMKKKTKKKNESFAAVAGALYGGDIPSPSRKGVKKMKKKGNTSVPYGSGYKKVNEQKEVKKIVVIYPGRFQPFGPHHKKVFDALSKRFDDAFITTSNIQQTPRHPLNFNEKVKHMVKMGVPKNKIIQERVPYVADNALKKFGKDTAVVYAVGRKDRGRFNMGKKKSGGLTYYQDFKSNMKNLKGYETHGYIYEAPHVKVSGISSGTEIRNLLGSPKFDEKKRQQIFRKTFGYFDKSTYEMMTSRFGKLFEFYQQPQVKKLMKEVSGFGQHFNASDMSDEGMYDFFGSLDDYYRISPEHAQIIGYELIDHPIKDTAEMAFTIMADEYEKDRTKTVTHGRTINQNRKNTESVDNPFPKYKERMRKILSSLGFEIVKYFGEESFLKMKESPLIQKKDVKKGVSHIKKIQEEFQRDVDLFIEAMCGVGQNPADTGCTPKGSSKTSFKAPKFQPKFDIPKFKLDPEKIKKSQETGKKEKEKALARPDRKPNIKNGVDVIRDEKDFKHFLDDFEYKADKGHDIDEVVKNMDNEYSKQKNKLTPEQQKQLEDDINSWKEYGGYEALKLSSNDFKKQIEKRNERISDLSHKNINNIGKAIERGIEVPSKDAQNILSRFKIGEMVEIPDESGHGSSGFSLSGEKARYFSKVHNDESDQTSILFRIEPNSKGQIRGLFIDGDKDAPKRARFSTDHSGEKEITRSSKSKAKVMSIETKRLPSGKEVKILTLQEPDDLTETIVRESDKKFSELSRKYLEGPLNPTPKKKKLQKEHLILEGGAYGHMNHPFDDNNLTFSDLRNIIILGIGGKLDREDKVSEKLDGQNLLVSWTGNSLRAARNKGHLKNRGKTSLNAKGVASKFAGRGNIKTAFVGAMNDLEKAIGSLSQAQKTKIFGNGTKWMNLEVIYPKTTNIIDYDVAEIVFHGTLQYDESGRQVGYSKEGARMLEGMIRQVNQNIQKRFKIARPNFLKVPKSQNFGKLKNKFLGDLKKLQSQYALKDSDRLGQYHESFWREYIFNASKQFKVDVKADQFVKLVNRWAYFDKSYKVPQIRKDFSQNKDFLNWILDTDKLDHNKMFKQNIKPFEILFFKVGAEILKNIQGFLAVSPDKAVEKIRQDVINALKDLQKPDNVEKLEKLKTQIEKLEAIGGLNAIVPSEGLVFKYKGNLYKFTGAFAPINQIVGSLKF